MKSKNISVTQILREIKMSIFRLSKNVILTILQGLNWEFGEIVQFLGDKFYKINS